MKTGLLGSDIADAGPGSLDDVEIDPGEEHKYLIKIKCTTETTAGPLSRALVHAYGRLELKDQQMINP